MIDRFREWRTKVLNKRRYLLWFARHERTIEGIIRHIIFPLSLGIFIVLLLRVYFLGHL